MWINTIVAYLHYLSFMLCFGALVLEAYTLKKELTLKETWTIIIADAIYGISATIIVITGSWRVAYFGKGWEYYLSNTAFYIKVSLFLVVGLLSLYPTVTFISWAKDIQKQQTPKLELTKLQRLQSLIRIELAGLIVIPLLATIMARGIE